MSFFNDLARFGDRMAVIADDGERLKYREVAERADDAVKGFRGTRALLAVECDNSVSALCSYLGALRARHPVLLVDADLPPAYKESLFATYCVTAVWRSRQRTWERLSGADAPPEMHEDLALLLSTSGTTGSPKLVRLSRDNIIANAQAIASYLGIGADERPITTMPMHYSYGLSVIHSHLLAGATLLLTSQSIASRSFWDFFKAERATSLAGVPTTYDLLQQLRLQKMDLPSLRTLTQAGGRLAPEKVRFFAELAQERGWRFFVMYGQTEASPRMAYLPFEQAIAKPASIGIPIPGGSFRLVDGNGAAVEKAHTEGELIYCGRNVMMGYAEKAGDLALGDTENGVLATGDVGHFDEDGYFYVTGRMKRFIKVFGNRVSLDEVEAYAKAQGMHAAATGKDDLLYLAVRNPARSVTDIAQQLCKQYRLHHSSVRVVKVDEFPLSSAGKIQYPRLLAALSEQA